MKCSHCGKEFDGRACWRYGLLLFVEDPTLFRSKTETETLPRPAETLEPSTETLPGPAGGK